MRLICVKVNGNVVTVQSHRWIQRGWTNNNAESYNHQLKLKNSWKQLGIRPLLDNIRGLIALQLSDLRRSLHGEGNFAITSVFRRHAVTYDRWITLTEDKKKRLFSRFLADCGGTVKTTTAVSSDGKLCISKTQRVARKPGQLKRARNVRTQ